MNVETTSLHRLFLRAAKPSALAVALAFLTAGGGYQVGGRRDGLPKGVDVIGVPEMENATTSYRIEQKLTSATVHEFLAATPYKISSNPAAADAVLRGKVVSLEAVPLLFDTKTGRATTMLVTVKCQVTLKQTDTQRVLFHTANFVLREKYEISPDVKSFFEEQDPALDSLARDFAARLVAAVTENY